jgi:hypothetical protein
MRSVGHVTSLFLAFVSWLWSGGALLASLVWGVGLRCDDACDGKGWRRSLDAWQWNGVIALGFVAFAAGTALLFFVWRTRRVYAASAFLVGLGAVLALATALSPQWAEHFGRRSVEELALFLAGATAPIGAVVLAESNARRSRASTQSSNKLP